MKQYTILHAIETGGPGGAETVLLNLATGLDHRRFRSLVLLPEDRWLRRKLREKGIPAFLMESRGRFDFRLLGAMASLVRRERVDLIHSHLPDQNFYSCVVGRLTGRKTIATYHGGFPLTQPRPARASIKLGFVRRSAAAVVVVSDYLERLAKSVGFPADKVVRIYNGVDTAQFAGAGSGRVRHELGCPNGTSLVGMVANLRAPKGYEYFIQAARRVAERIPQARFVAIGEQDEQIVRPLWKLLAEMHLVDRFFFIGFREDVPQVLSDLDVFVLSSVSEGFSLATIEAMAAGKPVIVTRSGGPQEIVEDGRTGLLVPPADPDALAEKICELLQNPERAAVLGRQGRAKVESTFALAGMLSAYERLYERCLDGN